MESTFVAIMIVIAAISSLMFVQMLGTIGY